MRFGKDVMVYKYNVVASQEMHLKDVLGVTSICSCYKGLGLKIRYLSVAIVERMLRKHTCIQPPVFIMRARIQVCIFALLNVHNYSQL